MKLSGSCRCGAVKFEMESRTPYPYMRCYCTVCRKTAGSAGYAINLMAAADSLVIVEDGATAVYNATINGQTSPAERHFCARCGSHLWLRDPRWPDLIHPHAGAIDSPLPTPPETVHIMLEFKADWVEVPEGPGHVHFQRYPDKSIEDWHKSWELYET
ncbi:GFA family protein [Labrenzia sp. 011]|uniref:GFA family protein n=1 Tax=Labrenzia sp. 011 TaxID=2171494 RepID=UPI000D50DBB2|nr:GFA family protein [Labrenzia sp. 011]PVB63624.1 alanine acetyltransferase [Labrenzia sp. 011]